MMAWVFGGFRLDFFSLIELDVEPMHSVIVNDREVFWKFMKIQ